MYENGCTPSEKGGNPPGPPPPLLPFQCLRLTAKFLLRRLRCQEDLSFKIVGPPSAGAIGGPSEEGGPSQTPLPFRPPPYPPSNTSPPPPPLLPFQCLRLTAKFLLWRQED